MVGIGVWYEMVVGFWKLGSGFYGWFVFVGGEGDDGVIDRSTSLDEDGDRSGSLD